MITCILGTRPEAIKFAPVILALRHMGLETRILLTGQHREMAPEALSWFGLKPDFDLDLMTYDQTPATFLALAEARIAPVIDDWRPELVLVLGDTASALAGALAAFYGHISVAHLEAGLRSPAPTEPFPEEMHRRLLSQIAELHFCPTPQNFNSLCRLQGWHGRRLVTTGNPVVDALEFLRAKWLTPATTAQGILVTAHRRESHGPPLERMCMAIKDLARDYRVTWPVHPHPAVQAIVHQRLDNTPNVHLTEPMGYPHFLQSLAECELVLTDSGGVQEEAPSFHKPCLVMRDVTERPEGIEVGNAILVGTSTDRIISEARRVLESRTRYDHMARAPNPYGDGHAAPRIAQAIQAWLQERLPPRGGHEQRLT